MTAGSDVDGSGSLTGGSVQLQTGYGSATSSGVFSVKTNNAGTDGVSGPLNIISGDTAAHGRPEDEVLLTRSWWGIRFAELHQLGSSLAQSPA